MTVNENTPRKPELITGDLFYVIQDGSYRLYKLLASDKDTSTYHVLAYEPVDKVPSGKDAYTLPVSVYHFPVDMNGFDKPVVIGNMTASAAELTGYHEYLRQTRAPENYTSLAIDYFNNGLFLTDEQKHEEAIDAYTKAADLFPLFYEAIDNRAFCKMNLALWEAAIDDFQESLRVLPDSTLAEFSIGECYLKLKRYPEAKAQFKKALAIDPAHQLSKNFLEHVNTLL